MKLVKFWCVMDGDHPRPMTDAEIGVHGLPSESDDTRSFEVFLASATKSEKHWTVGRRLTLASVDVFTPMDHDDPSLWVHMHIEDTADSVVRCEEMWAVLRLLRWLHPLFESINAERFPYESMGLNEDDLADDALAHAAGYSREQIDEIREAHERRERLEWERKKAKVKPKAEP